ncbi:hypothetical protein [Paenibacillus sp. 37]|uniref:hypothetical protein n=1 Tax=Paenibacillus sp. 37 TaxID=2607911 RepID=UPI00122DF42C|nr:hypothetical protein [Paenibacillus sp. 37]
MPSMYRYIRQVNIKSERNEKLSNESVQDQIIKRDLFVVLKVNSRFKKLMSTKAKVFESIAIIALIILLFSILGNMIYQVWTGKDTSYLFGIAYVVLFLLGIGGVIGSSIASNFYIKKEYSDLSFLVNFWILNFNKDVLFSIQCDAVHTYLKSKGKMNSDFIDYLIGYYMERSESLRKLRWLPVAIFTAFLFPLWNIFLNKMFTDSDLIIALGIIATLIPVATINVWIFRRNIEPIFFAKPNKYLQLATILRTIKTF